MPTQLGEYLRELRTAKGLTTRQLASAAACSQALITLVEKGERTPSLVRLWQLVKVLEGDLRQAFFYLLLDSGIPEEAVQEVISTYRSETPAAD